MVEERDRTEGYYFEEFLRVRLDELRLRRKLTKAGWGRIAFPNSGDPGRKVRRLLNGEQRLNIQDLYDLVRIINNLTLGEWISGQMEAFRDHIAELAE